MQFVITVQPNWYLRVRAIRIRSIPETNNESYTYPEVVGARQVSRAQRAQCRAETERPSSGPWGTPPWRNTPEGGPNQPPGNRFQDASLDSVATL